VSTDSSALSSTHRPRIFAVPVSAAQEVERAASAASGEATGQGHARPPVAVGVGEEPLLPKFGSVEVPPRHAGGADVELADNAARHGGRHRLAPTEIVKPPPPGGRVAGDEPPEHA